jgi:hypothetical protein
LTLRFCTEARHHFDPVAQRFGLLCVAYGEHNVRYENDKVFLDVKFDNRRSYELGLEIGKRHTIDPSPGYSLAEILRLRGVPDAAFVSALMIRDESRLPGILARLVRLTLDHAADFLMGNGFAFAQVKKFRNRESAEFELAAKLSHARLAVNTAWTAKNYKAVVKAFAPLEPFLSPAEKKRLEYSRKQISGSL